MSALPRRLIGLFLAALLIVSVAHAKDKRIDRLPDRHRDWIVAEVTWIITKGEKEEFLALESDAERDDFIEQFWAKRDPQPLTVENEYQIEHWARLAHAERNLGTETSRKGWQTDRGRVWILLGKPDDVERIVSHNEVYPYEMWFYGRRTAPGLPGQLRLVFYRAFGLGEYKLLNPVLDQDRMFPPHSQINRNSTEEMIALLGPEVNRALISVSPGYGLNASDEIIQELRSPHKIRERLLERGLSLNARVTTRTAFDPIDVPMLTVASPRSDGSSRLHIAVALPPEEVTFQEVTKGRFMARIDVFGDIKDARGIVVASFDEAATLDLQREALEQRKDHPFVFQAARTLVPGTYQVSLFLQDFTHGQLGRARRQVVISDRTGGPKIDVLFTALDVDRVAPSEAERPFVIEGFKLFPRVAGRFRRGEPLYAFGVLREPTGGLGGEVKMSVSILRDGESVFANEAEAPPARGSFRPFVIGLPTGGLEAGAYQIQITAGGEHLVARAETGLEVVEKALGRGQFVYEEKRPQVPEVEHYNRGVQFLSKGDVAAAQKHFRIALGHRATFKPAAVYLARTLLLTGGADEAKKIIDRILAREPLYYDALVTRGTLHLTVGQYPAAVASFRAALENGQRTKELLNGLGEATMNMKQPDEARRWFEESLEIDPNQAAIRARLDGLGS